MHLPWNDLIVNKILLKSRRVVYYGNQMQWVPLIGIENLYFYVVETYSNKICCIFFYNFLVHLYCFNKWFYNIIDPSLMCLSGW